MIEIAHKEQCCGCSACVHICPKHSISFQEDKEGFLYPKIDLATCIDCGLCEKVCPVINQEPEREPLEVYAAKNDDESIRLKSSSGGIFTLMAEKIIDEGGVVFGAKFNENWEVVHDYTDTVEGLDPFRGSKYVQSVIGETYKQAESFLKVGRKVMFTGTPCQIAGLKKYLRKDYENLLTVDFVCHGVPSPLVWRMYLEEESIRFGKDINAVEEINFRDKSTGWKTYSFSIKLSKNIVSSAVFTDNNYMGAFLSNLSIRPCCYHCPAKAGRSGADITIGDFWGIENVLPELDDDRGMSVLVNYNENNYLPKALQTVRCGEILVANPCLVKSVNKQANREFFFSRLSRKGFNYAVKKTFSSRFINRLIRYAYRIMA